MKSPYRGFKNAPVQDIPIRVPAHSWRFESLLGTDMLKRRVGQYAGPVHEHECLPVGRLRLEFRTLSKKDCLLLISDDISGKLLQRHVLSLGNSKIAGPENTEISILTYVIADEMIRCSIIIEKKE